MSTGRKTIFQIAAKHLGSLFIALCIVFLSAAMAQAGGNPDDMEVSGADNPVNGTYRIEGALIRLREGRCMTSAAPRIVKTVNLALSKGRLGIAAAPPSGHSGCRGLGDQFSSRIDWVAVAANRRPGFLRAHQD